jgi:hypothetical protein
MFLEAESSYIFFKFIYIYYGHVHSHLAIDPKAQQ